MPLSEDTKIVLGWKSLAGLIAVCTLAAWRLWSDEMELKHVHNRMCNTRGWVYCLFHPDEDWSKNWKSAQRWDDDE